jgi:hypothetical protein
MSCRMRRIRGFLVAAVLLLGIAAPAWADVTLADLNLAARVLSFMDAPPSGNVRLGIVYAPGNEQSLQDASAVAKLLGAGLQAGNVVFIAVLVPIDQVLTAPVDAFFLPEGIGDQGRRIADATEKRKIPCITVDLPRVQDGSCVLGLRTQPKIQIYLSRSAAARSNTAFASVFRMMVTEF